MKCHQGTITFHLELNKSSQKALRICGNFEIVGKAYIMKLVMGNEEFAKLQMLF